MIALVERTLTRLADTKMPSKSVAFISFLSLSRNVEIIKNFSCARECERAAIKKEFFSFVMAKALKFISLIKFYFMEVRGGLGNIFCGKILILNFSIEADTIFGMQHPSKKGVLMSLPNFFSFVC